MIRQSGLQRGEAAARGISDTSVCERPTASDVYCMQINVLGGDIIICLFELWILLLFCLCCTGD